MSVDVGGPLTADSGSSVVVTWDYVEGRTTMNPAIMYELLSSTNQSFSDVGSVVDGFVVTIDSQTNDNSERLFKDDDLQINKTYYFKFRYQNADGKWSNYSNVVSAFIK